MGGGEVVRYLSHYGTNRVSKAVLISSVTPYLLKDDGNPDGVGASVFKEDEEQLRKIDRLSERFRSQVYGRSVVHHTVSEPELEWTQ